MPRYTAPPPGPTLTLTPTPNLTLTLTLTLTPTPTLTLTLALTPTLTLTQDLKSALLKGEISQELRTPQGEATLRVAASGVRLSHRFGGTDTIELSPSVLRVDLSDAASLHLMRSADAVAADGIRCVCDTQQRDLLVLVARTLSAVQREPTQEGKCQVWEGEGYVDYYGSLHGQVILLYEGTEPPAGDATASEALVLHGCTAEMVTPLPEDDAEEEAWELSISDAEGEIYSINLPDAEAQRQWLEALEGRSRPQDIGRATHILLKHQNSRRLASWRDPDGEVIKQRTPAEATRLLLAWKRAIDLGEQEIAELAREHSDCDTAEQGGDLGWFAAGYMQQEFEDAVMDLEVGQLSEVVETASGLHLILRTG